MKKILLTLLLTIFFIPVVKAEEQEWTLFTNKDFSTSYHYSAIVGDYLYVFSGQTSSSSSSKINFSQKIELLTGIVTNISNINFNIRIRGACTSVGTDIYFFGGLENSTFTTSYKYDTLTDTYTQIASLPVAIYGSRAVAIGTDIYIVGGQTKSSSGIVQTIYKYDTLTDTYTTYTPFSSPRGTFEGLVTSVGTDIYIFGSFYDISTMASSYKYDTLTNTLTSIKLLPEKMTGWAISVDTDIYLFSYSSTTVYKYDTLTDTYETVDTLLRNTARPGNVVLYNNGIIYDIGGNYESAIYSYPLVINSPVPDEPGIVADTTLNNFYSIYLEKLKSLSEFATENKFVLSAISIFIFFALLASFIYLVERRKR